VNTLTDPMFCGATDCPPACSAGLACSNGNCGVCLSTSCSGACLNATQLANDPQNCGACGNACKNNQVCVPTGGQPSGACHDYYVVWPLTQACVTGAGGTCVVGTTCCPGPNGGAVYCVVGNTCPQG
jgi:hypothetical protein